MKESPINNWLLHVTQALIHVLQRDDEQSAAELKKRMLEGFARA